ncbi:MAG: hypothetical protein MJZ19_11210 [Paludibacteraceae bacterium]|nr:hypothetical protein [Paludibacteraceae bacterium]MCQ2200268.1 hypothetical protein [Paludibacteraceae bacterium]
MAELAINGRLSVKGLKAKFKEAFGLTLRVYQPKADGTINTGRGAVQVKDESVTLASLAGQKCTDELKAAGNTKVGNFEDKFEQLFHIGVQVANADDSALANNDDTLAAAAKK